MINIQPRLEQEKIEHNLNGFIKHLNKVLLHPRKNKELIFKYEFERDFYNQLLNDENFLKDIILCNKDDLLCFENLSFYKNHKLFFLFSMHESIRNRPPFNIDFIKEIAILPRSFELDKIEEISSEVQDRCFKIFNYDKFSKVNKKKKADRTLWNGYNYLSGFSPKVCPYCNLDNITLLEDCIATGEVYYILRPAIDHFLAKSLYPFFSVSIYNLIPSCTSCNTSLKSDNDFKSPPHMSPMGGDFNDSIEFSLKMKEPNHIFSIIDDIYNLGEINYNNIVVSIDSDDNTATMNIETFKLNARYNEHLITIDKFLNKLPKAKINSIKTYQVMFDYNSYDEALDSFLDYNSDEGTHCDLAFSFLKKGVLRKYL